MDVTRVTSYLTSAARREIAFFIFVLWSHSHNKACKFEPTLSDPLGTGHNILQIGFIHGLFNGFVAEALPLGLPEVSELDLPPTVAAVGG